MSERRLRQRLEKRSSSAEARSARSSGWSRNQSVQPDKEIAAFQSSLNGLKSVPAFHKQIATQPPEKLPAASHWKKRFFLVSDGNKGVYFDGKFFPMINELTTFGVEWTLPNRRSSASSCRQRNLASRMPMELPSKPIPMTGPRTTFMTLAVRSSRSLSPLVFRDEASFLAFQPPQFRHAVANWNRSTQYSVVRS